MDTNTNTTITMVTSKKGIKTCKISGRFLHSQYRPLEEAKRYFSTQKQEASSSSNTPQIVILVGAGLEYDVQVLKTMYKQSKIVGIYFHKVLFDNNKADYALLFHQNDRKDFCSKYRNILMNIPLDTTNKYSQIIMYYWPPSAQIWKDEIKQCFQSIQESISLHFSEKRTEQYFMSQWIRNACFHYLHLNTFLTFTPGTIPVVVVSAGPTLNSHIPMLRKQRSHYLLIAVSSALHCLHAYNIRPDIVVHQDASYYASKHLQLYDKNVCDIIALPLSASRNLLSRNATPLILNTNQESDLLLQLDSKIPSVAAYGTVSGTALELGWQLTNNTVYLVGFDVSVDISGSHCKPHGTFNGNITGNRLFSLETYIVQSYAQCSHTLKQKRYNMPIKQNESLKIYADWFLAWQHPWKYERCKILVKNDGMPSLGIPNATELPAPSQYTIDKPKPIKHQRPPIEKRAHQIKKYIALWNNPPPSLPHAYLRTLQHVKNTIPNTAFNILLENIQKYLMPFIS